MTDHEFCQDKALLVTYLYGECDAVERRAIEDHLATCAACSAEVEQLRSTRASLAEWEVPDRALGIRLAPVGSSFLDPVASDERRVLAPSRPRWMPPWWLQAAAALLLVAGAAGLAQIEVRYGSDGLVVRTGWGKTDAPVAAGVQSDAQTETWRRDLAALEQELRRELSPSRAPATAAPGASQVSGDQDAGAPSVTEAALLRRVQTLIDQSEQRQRREVAIRLTQVLGEVEGQRRADLRGMRQTFGQLEDQTGIAVRQNEQLVNYLMQVSQQR